MQKLGKTNKPVPFVEEFPKIPAAAIDPKTIAVKIVAPANAPPTLKARDFFFFLPLSLL